jgi:hypothetical protein
MPTTFDYPVYSIIKLVVGIETSVECRLSTESIRERNLGRARAQEKEKYKEKRHIHVVYIFIQSERERTRERERKRERDSMRECGQTQRTRGLLASSRERSVGRFSRLRTPLGLVMRRLSATAIERPAVSPMPPCTQRLCRIGQACARRFTTMGLLFSLRSARHRPSGPAPRLPRFAQAALHRGSSIKRRPTRDGLFRTTWVAV